MIITYNRNYSGFNYGTMNLANLTIHVSIFVQLGFSSNTEQTAGQSSGSNFSVLSFRLADQMKLTHL